MITVAGGTYREICILEEWDQLFGSGVRAAAALAHHSDGVVLETYCGTQELQTLGYLASTFGFDLRPTVTSSTGIFKYLHSMADPHIRASTHSDVPPIRVKAQHVLRFGMLEPDCQVDAEWAVYDPQSENEPQSFGTNGSTADHLAIVANYEEGASLTGIKGTTEISAALLDCGAEVVVLKCGARGAQVTTREGSKRVPVFRTDFVWPIGSGDVFSALFAHCWAESRQDPFEAAYYASMAAAYYCSTVSLPVPQGLTHESFTAKPLVVPEDSPAPQIYLAGPYFSTEQRWLINEARQVLARQGIAVFSPFHEVSGNSANTVADMDLRGLRASQAVLAFLDGTDLGTVFEVGYARALGIPVIVMTERLDTRDLTMVVGTGCELADKLSTAVYLAVWSALAR